MCQVQTLKAFLSMVRVVGAVNFCNWPREALLCPEEEAKKQIL